MPIESNKPPDPLFDELCSLKNMTSADEIREASLKDTKVKVVKGKPCKPHRGVKVCTPGSAGAGSVLRRTRFAKVSGKARVRAEESLDDNRGGKRAANSPMNDEISKVLSGLRSGSFNSNLKFSMGHYVDVSNPVCSLNHEIDANVDCNVNDGSFINSPLENSVLNEQCSPVAKSCGPKTSLDHSGMGDVGNTSSGLASSEDGIASAKTGIVIDKGIAGSGNSSEHTNMEDVVSIGAGQASSQDGIASDKGGSGFEFRKNVNSDGILKKPIGPVFNVQFSNVVKSNPFGMSSNGKGIGTNNGGWNASFGNKFGLTVLSILYSAVVDRFAEKLKQGSEEMALKLEFTPNSVIKQDNGKRRIEFSAEEIVKGAKLVLCNCMGILWFKSEDGMKKVLESGPWMVQNVPLVLNVWEPGIWLDKTEPSVIPNCVCIYNIPMELCNGNGIGKLDFARVLVEVSADDDLPSLLEIYYPPIGNRPAKVGVLDVKYQWKPPLCTHCKTFEHSTLSCMVRPRTEEEVTAKNLKDTLKIGKPDVEISGKKNVDDDRFTVVGKKNRPAALQMNAGQPKSGGQNKWGGRFQGNVRQGYSNMGSGNSSFNRQRRFGGGVQGNQFQQKSSSNAGNNGINRMSSGKNTIGNKAAVQEVKKKSLVEKPDLADLKCWFEVLDDEVMKDQEECVLETMEEEYNSEIWPKLKQDVIDVMETGIYPASNVRAEWSLAQINFFYSNCHKYGLDPSYEDDDVATEDGDMAKEMRAEDVDLDACNSDIETKVKKRNLVRICSTMLGPWQWVSNNASCSNGTGIIVVWDPNSVRVMVISQSLQLMNLFVESVDGLHRFYCSFVYAHVRASGRKVLWKELMCHSLVVKDEPWLLMGDFNVILDPFERSAGSSYFTSSMEDFRDCLGEIGVEDVGMSGLKFTWNKSLGRTDVLLKKLDRVMCSGAFLEKFVNSYALFLPFVASDHAPAVIEIPVILGAKPRPFKFANFLADKGEFLPIVKKLERVQSMMVDDSFNLVLREKETECLRAYKDAMRDEESMVKQIAKGKRFSGQHVGAQFVKHFQSVLGEAKLVNPISYPCLLFVKRLSLEDAEFMVRPMSKDEIKSVFFAMNDEKAPGPNGFLSNFFKAACSVIGDEVCTAISDFFKNGRLLKEVNATIIALVPKSKSPQKVSDFRPISCCNVIYKAITKIIANRIKGYLGMLVDECHNAFIPMRQISNNVLLSQELVRNYHRNCGPSKVAFKIDIHKAYDSVEWSFMKHCLVHFGFHNDMITWIMSCLSSPMFSVNVNGYSHGFFKGMRGLRQGDPLSPNLFTLVMEVFSLMVKRKIEDDGNFKYHWRCDKLKITHLSFTDDLTVFSSADLHSVKILSNDLSEFSGVSGLVPNLDKSYV
ncbi:hypothetical protein Tco_0134475 [Tanacetum coccineum]